MPRMPAKHRTLCLVRERCGFTLVSNRGTVWHLMAGRGIKSTTANLKAKRIGHDGLADCGICVHSRHDMSTHHLWKGVLGGFLPKPTT